MLSVDEETICLFGHVIDELTLQNVAGANLPFAAEKDENWSTTFEVSSIFQVSLQEKKWERF